MTDLAPEEIESEKTKIRGQIQELLTEYANLEHPDDSPAIVTDTITIYGEKSFAEGRMTTRVGYVICNEDQPDYVAIGLLSFANDLLLSDWTDSGVE